MNLEGSRFAGWWADRYTRGLPAEVRDARCAEIASDVFEQCHGTATSDPRGRSVAWRTIRGVHADLAWRRQEQRRMQATFRPPSRIRHTWAVMTQNWFAPLSLLVGAFNLLFALAVATQDSSEMPGRAIGPVMLVAATALLAGGLWLRWRTGTTRGAGAAAPERAAVPIRWTVFLLAVLVPTLGLLVVGAGAGSPALVLLAFVLVAGAVVALGVRLVARAVRSADPGSRMVLADGMIVVAMIPALGMFWMVIPPIVAIAVVVGVVTTNPRVRPVA